jgi:hypothetical protein
MLFIDKKFAFGKSITTLLLRSSDLKEVPQGIREMKQLTHVCLIDNLIDKIPSWIANLKNLKIFEIGGENIPTNIEILGGLPCLEKVLLKSVHSTYLPESLMELQNIKSLELIFPSLQSTGGVLSKLHNLSHLSLQSEVMSCIPEDVYKLNKLSRLGIFFPVLDVEDGIFKKKSLKRIDTYSDYVKRFSLHIFSRPDMKFSLDEDLLDELPNNVQEFIYDRLVD